MAKGCQKKTIHIKDMQSRFYEEAYFVLKSGVGDTGAAYDDMIEEAVRIATESLVSLKNKKKTKVRHPSLLSFFSGTAFGCILCALAIIIL